MRAIGVASGVLMGLVVVYVIGQQTTGWALPYIFPASMAIQMVVAAMLSAVLAGLYPARRAARIDVVEALSYE